MHSSPDSALLCLEIHCQLSHWLDLILFDDILKLLEKARHPLLIRNLLDVFFLCKLRNFVFVRDFLWSGSSCHLFEISCLADRVTRLSPSLCFRREGFSNCRFPVIFRTSACCFLSKIKFNAMIETLSAPDWSDLSQRHASWKWERVELFPDLADASCRLFSSFWSLHYMCKLKQCDS